MIWQYELKSVDHPSSLLVVETIECDKPVLNLFENRIEGKELSFLEQSIPSFSSEAFRRSRDIHLGS